MAAYGVFMRERTHDPAALQRYAAMASSALIGHAVTPLALYGHHEAMAGPEIEGGAVLRFPTFEEAKIWYDSPAYRAAREHRIKGADYRAVIVEGMCIWQPTTNCKASVLWSPAARRASERPSSRD